MAKLTLILMVSKMIFFRQPDIGYHVPVEKLSFLLDGQCPVAF
jgi:hypothetical protein